MDAQRQRELNLKRDIAKRAPEVHTKVDSFKTLIEPLDSIGAHYLVIPSGHELLRGASALAALESFPFDSYGHLDSQETVPKSEWRTILSDEFAADRRAYLAWKDSEYCLEAVLSDILPALYDVFIDYHWDAYLFDPFAGWVIESHHDGYLATIGAESGRNGD